MRLKLSNLMNVELDDKTTIIGLFIYTFFILFFCSMMSPLYPINEWSDVNLYFNIGKSMFNGLTPYTEVFDHKGPFIFLLYGIGYLISNTSFIGIFFIQLICWFTMIYITYSIAKLFLDKGYAFLVALAFPLLFLSHTMEGGSAEEFLSATMVISLFLFVRVFYENKTTHRAKYMLIHGLMCGVVFCTKLSLLVFWIFPLTAIFLNILLNKEYKNFIRNIFAYIGGILIITIPFCVYLYSNDALNDAYNIYIELNRSYAKVGNVSEILSYLGIRFYQRLRFETVEFIIILIGAIYFPIKYFQNKLYAAATILSFGTLFTIIFMSPTYIFYYSIPYYIFTILGCTVIGDYLSKYIKVHFVWHICLFFMIVGIGIGTIRKDFFGYSSEVLTRRAEAETLVNQFSKIIEKEKNPTLLNLSLDLGNVVFTKCNILPNVKYFISPNLTHDFYPQMRNEQTEYIRDKKVQFIILSVASLNYDYYKDLPDLNENYTIIDSFVEKGVFDKTYYLYKRND